MGFCSTGEYKFFIEQVVLLEKMLKEDNFPVIKFWFFIGEAEQAKRIEERKTNPLKQWKLSTVGALAQAKWNDYTPAWLVVQGNDTDKACMEAMGYIRSRMKYELKGETGSRLEPDPNIVQLQPTLKLPHISYENSADLDDRNKVSLKAVMQA